MCVKQEFELQIIYIKGGIHTALRDLTTFQEHLPYSNCKWYSTALDAKIKAINEQEDYHELK